MRSGIFSIIICTIFLSCISTKYDCVDKRACREIEEKLNLIIDFNFYYQPSNGEVMAAGNFLTELSGIESGADVQIDGLLPPTMNDLDKWSAWYNANFNMLRYDRKNDSIYLIR